MVVRVLMAALREIVFDSLSSAAAACPIGIITERAPGRGAWGTYRPRPQRALRVCAVLALATVGVVSDMASSMAYFEPDLLIERPDPGRGATSARDCAGCCELDRFPTASGPSSSTRSR